MAIHWSRHEPGRGAGSGDDPFFVSRVTVREKRHWRPVDAFVVVGWSLILGKCVLASWAIERWSVPVSDFYVWVPSCVFGALCTWLYLSRPGDR
ncbi:hypothetical protein ASA1KI_14020 [Opitutales bacterium ASA1]|uniref:hypothetical protein n=1 Tax=Congregicoccus parvus TaxID=3081749 RepID=UPI002B325AF6|nr:hypothetical protein ASA1KI_14020 [Opitutales bacterium ASA1]